MGDVLWTFHGSLDSVGYGNFVCEQLEARHLSALLAGFLFEPLITGTKRFEILPQAVIAGDLQGHPEVAGDKTEQRNSADKRKSENDIDELIGYVNPP